MKGNTYASLALCALLAACGGGGGGGGGGGAGTTPPPPPDPDPPNLGSQTNIERVDKRASLIGFGGADPAGGVARRIGAITATGGVQGPTTAGYFLADYGIDNLRLGGSALSSIYDTGTWANAGFTLSSTVFASTTTVTHDGERFILRAGQVDYGTEQDSFTVYVSDNRTATLQFVQADEAGVTTWSDYLNTEGLALSGDLPLGEHAYSGYNMAFATGSSVLVGTREDGSFDMMVNFEMGRVTAFTATTANSRVEGTVGDNQLNIENGAFRGDVRMSGALFNHTRPIPMLGKIYGDFHGSAAVGVSGVYHNDGFTPGSAGGGYGGGFAGQREDP